MAQASGDERPVARAPHARVEVALDVLVERARRGGGHQHCPNQNQLFDEADLCAPFDRQTRGRGERDRDADAQLEEVEDVLHAALPTSAARPWRGTSS